MSTKLNMKDIRNELYNHMVECAPDNAGFNDVQKPYIIEYMQRYLDSQKNENTDKIKETIQKLKLKLCTELDIYSSYKDKKTSKAYKQKKEIKWIIDIINSLSDKNKCIFVD